MTAGRPGWPPDPDDSCARHYARSLSSARSRWHDHAAHDHSAHDPGAFRRKFWLSLPLTIPTLVFSHGLQDILGLAGPRFPGSQYIPAVFGLAIFFYGGTVFLRGGIQELRAKQPGMMTLISLAIVVAFGYSAAVTLGLDGMDFWWELATLITIMLLGHWIEMSAIMGAQNALGELAKLLPDEAELLHGDHTMTVPVSELVLGDLVLVKPGASVPVDGDVVDGESEVNEALLTGESLPGGEIRGHHRHRRQHQRQRRAHGARHEGRRRHRARRHHAPGRRRAGQQVGCADPRRPGGGLAVLRGARGRGAHAGGLVAPAAG